MPGFACAVKSNGACGSVFTLNLSKVPLPMSVGVTPWAGPAHVIAVYTAATNNRQKSLMLHFVIFRPIACMSFLLSVGSELTIGGLVRLLGCENLVLSSCEDNSTMVAKVPGQNGNMGQTFTMGGRLSRTMAYSSMRRKRHSACQLHGGSLAELQCHAITVDNRRAC
jgi:hypothetical protein